jgi:hypothetical protein
MADRDVLEWLAMELRAGPPISLNLAIALGAEIMRLRRVVGEPIPPLPKAD